MIYVKMILCKGNYILIEILSNWLKYGCYRLEYFCDGFFEYFFFIYCYIKFLCLFFGYFEESFMNYYELVDGVICSVGYINRRSFIVCLFY